VVQPPRAAILPKKKRNPILDPRTSKPVTAADIRRTIRPTTLEVREDPALSQIFLGEGLVKYHDRASSYLGDFCLLWSSILG
jgi:hypothetical protein